MTPQTSRGGRLADLLVSLFSPDGLRRFLRFLPEGDRLVVSLPDRHVSDAELAHTAVDLLERQGLLDAEFFERLRAELPRRAADIDRVAMAWSPPAPSEPNVPSPAPGDRPSVIIVHADDGLTAAEILRIHLLKQSRRHPVDVLVVHAREWLPDYMQPPSVVSLVLFTPGLLEPGQQYVEHMLRHLLTEQRRSTHQVIPILIEPTQWRTTALGRLPPLPGNSIPISGWRDPDAAWADVIQGVTRSLSARSSVEAQPAVSAVDKVSRGLSSKPQAPPVVLKINRIFRTTGVPDVNFVAPAQLQELQLRMSFMGEGLVVEGPSGIGKTTAARHAMTASLGASFDALTGGGRVRWLQSKSPDDVAALARLLDAGHAALTGHLVIDDFHRLERPLQRRVADFIKLIADASNDTAKIVVIGINPVGASLVQDFPDLAGRFAIVSMSKQPDEKIDELITRGERAANITFDKRPQFVRAARGSFFTAQLLCLEAAVREGIAETSPEPRIIVTGPDGVVLDKVHARLKFKYHEALISFASYDENPPPRGACLCLLWLLARSSDNTVSLATAKVRYPALGPAIDWLLKSNLAALFARVPRLAELIFYNRDAAILSAEDPQLEFYLSNLNWPALARDSGHPTLDWDPERGFAAGPAASVTVGEPAPPPTLTRVLLPRSRVLHLSDLHFDTQEHAIQWYDQLHEDLRGELGYDSLDAVILSGDISNHAIPSEFDAASQCMRDLQADFKLTPSQFVLVPGNHDVSWTRSRQAYKVWRREDYKDPLIAGQFIDKNEYIEVPDDTNHRARFQPFADFYYAVRLEPYPLDYEYQATVHHFADKKLLVLGLNSAWQLDHHFHDRADIHGVALGRALRRIQQEPSYADCLKLAVWHHPLQSPDPDRLRDTGFVERLAQAGFRLALHGHIHRPQQGLFRYDMAAGGRRIDFLGAGTCGAPTREWLPGYPLQYQILEFHDHSVTVHSRRREELGGAWKPDARWTQGPGQQPLAYYTIDL